eukprot:2927941-Amphidinium_carterae.1
MVFCRKPISKSQRQERQLVRPVIEKSRICICGNFQEAFYQDTSTTNAPVVLVRPPSEVVKMGLVPPSTLWRCTKAVYGLKESPKMWEVHRDK